MAEFREDPYLDRNFRIQISGLEEAESARAQFSEVSGLTAEVEVVEYRAGNQKTNGVRKLAGQPRYENVTLRRGVLGDLGIWEWIDTAIDGQPEKRTVIIELLNGKREVVLVWKLRNAWPCRYRGPHLDADGKSVALEELELCHEGLTLE